jgi:hypothetical protein
VDEWFSALGELLLDVDSYGLVVVSALVFIPFAVALARFRAGEFARRSMLVEGREGAEPQFRVTGAKQEVVARLKTINTRRQRLISFQRP